MQDDTEVISQWLAVVDELDESHEHLRNTSMMELSPLGVGSAAPHSVKIAVGQCRPKALLADWAALADLQSTRHRLLVKREE